MRIIKPKGKDKEVKLTNDMIGLNAIHVLIEPSTGEVTIYETGDEAKLAKSGIVSVDGIEP